MGMNKLLLTLLLIFSLVNTPLMAADSIAMDSQTSSCCCSSSSSSSQSNKCGAAKGQMQDECGCSIESNPTQPMGSFIFSFGEGMSKAVFHSQARPQKLVMAVPSYSFELVYAASRVRVNSPPQLRAPPVLSFRLA